MDESWVPQPLKEDNRPDYIKNNEVSTGEIEYGGKKYFFTVLKKEVGPKTLPGFLGKDGEHFFISEEAPEKFRVLQLTHEIIEFTELEGKKGRCLEALKRELLLVPDEIRKEYIEYRRNLFNNLIQYYKKLLEDKKLEQKIKESYEDIEKEMKGSYEYLCTL
ncbi:MAG: hypothetical protein V4439_01705 [Patescibacteria group bacterium]